DFNDHHIDLIDEGHDVAIRIARLKDSSLMARKLAPVHHVLCTSPDYLKQQGVPEKPADLKDHHILHYTNVQSTTWHLTGPDGRKHAVPLPIRMVANNGVFLKQAAMNGQGIILSPTFIVWKEIASGELVTVLDDYACLSLNAYAVYPQTQYLPQRVRRFIDFIADKFSGAPYWDKDMPV
ncbi:MAG: substrate binding domain-containing protein, partial [Emcibacter sp.]|nr:substrate binding domain-containing protein [Emcibacter sp.]